MILCGIDEAGYGPLLGPLVVGCAAFEIAGADPAADPPPCLWQRLRKIVGKHRPRAHQAGRRLHVNDSKQVYSPAAGLRELERSVLAFAAVATSQNAWDAGLQSLLRHLAPDAEAELAQHPWYQPPPDERFPLELDALSIRMLANALQQEMRCGGMRLVHLAARVLPERQLNRLFQATRNKASVLFSQAAIHLDHLLRQHAGGGLVIWCDRQGGREHYGPLLRLMFEDWALEITRQEEAHSEYRLRRAGHTARLIFCEKAEGQCLPVALASMLSKYLREALMRRFNAYWQRRQPGLSPTAGYYEDGLRFLQDIQQTRQQMGVPDDDLVRSR